MTMEQRVVYRYVPNNASFAQFLMSDSVSDVAVAAARDLAAIAKGFSPRSSGEGPHYADQFEVRKDVAIVKDGRFDNPRRSAVLVNTSDHAAQVEFGDGNREEGEGRPQGGSHGEPARPMGRAAASFPGGVYRENGGR